MVALKGIVRSLSDHPAIYHLVQRLSGRSKSARQLARYFRVLQHQTVLDVGAGTSSWRDDMPRVAKYIWLDVAHERYGAAKLPAGDLGLVSSASEIGLADRSVDYAVCIAVSHHLPDADFLRALTEMERVTRKGVVFVDALWMPRSAVSRAMWAVDAGSYPKTLETLRRMMASRFEVVEQDVYRVLHTYWACVATRRPT